LLQIERILAVIFCFGLSFVPAAQGDEIRASHDDMQSEDNNGTFDHLRQDLKDSIKITIKDNPDVYSQLEQFTAADFLNFDKALKTVSGIGEDQKKALSAIVRDFTSATRELLDNGDGDVPQDAASSFQRAVVEAKQEETNARPPSSKTPGDALSENIPRYRIIFDESKPKSKKEEEEEDLLVFLKQLALERELSKRDRRGGDEDPEMGGQSQGSGSSQGSPMKSQGQSSPPIHGPENSSPPQARNNRSNSMNPMPGNANGGQSGANQGTSSSKGPADNPSSNNTDDFTPPTDPSSTTSTSPQTPAADKSEETRQLSSPTPSSLPPRGFGASRATYSKNKGNVGKSRSGSKVTRNAANAMRGGGGKNKEGERSGKGSDSFFASGPRPTNRAALDSTEDSFTKIVNFLSSGAGEDDTIAGPNDILAATRPRLPEPPITISPRKENNVSSVIFFVGNLNQKFQIRRLLNVKPPERNLSNLILSRHSSSQ
jgi:hypothetical protein